MKSNLLFAVILTLTVLTAGCVPAQVGTQIPVDTPSIPQTGPTATLAATETPPAAATRTSTALPATPVRTTTATETILTINVNPEGQPTPFLVDGRGRSLYAYMDDVQNSRESSCVDDCAVEWPPVFVNGTPAAGPGVDAALLGSLARDDGSVQATYNGWPLYYYNMDTIPGTKNGQEYNDLWFLVSPLGDPIQR